MSDFITGYICLTDIPKSAIKKADNGKLYVNIVIAQRQNEGKYGETHTIFMSQSKDERDAKAEKCYIGSGKAYQPKEESTPVTAESVAEMPSISEQEADDLPF